MLDVHKDPLNLLKSLTMFFEIMSLIIRITGNMFE